MRLTRFRVLEGGGEQKGEGGERERAGGGRVWMDATEETREREPSSVPFSPDLSATSEQASEGRCPAKTDPP